MLPVYFEKRRVGDIVSDADGPAFTYSDEWRQLPGAFPISISMPQSEGVIDPIRFAPWAANLLPEAAQLTAVGRHLGVAPADLIGLLSEIGRDTAGALSFAAPGGTESNDWRRIETPADLERILLELPHKPFLAGDDGISMSLAGVQTKLAVAVDDSGRLHIPINGSPSTHILKPDSDRLFGSVQNEAFCLILARLCGLKAPQVTTGVAGSRKYFLISRYDRRPYRGVWRRVHQEDFCQALGKPPFAKYEKNQTGIGGPKLTDMLNVVRQHMSAVDVLGLLDMVTFNVLCCNTDAHAKNYSIIIGSKSSTLAPIYDVMCAEPYEGITRNLAQTIGGKNRGEHIRRRHWLRFFADAGLAATSSISRIRKLAERVQANAEKAAGEVAQMPAGTHMILELCVRAVVSRADAILAGLDDHTGDQEPQNDDQGASRSKA
jgi:serine/threonine-protein kinase HipA